MDRPVPRSIRCSERSAVQSEVEMESSQRKKLKRIEVSGHARFLTFSCYRRLALFSNDAIMQCFVDRLRYVHREGEVKLIAWVVMPEHVHLLVLPCTDTDTIPTYLGKLKTGFAKKVIGRWRTLNAPVLARVTGTNGRPHFWQAGGGYDRTLREGDRVEKVITYIHQNPVRRGLVKDAADWEWSSARAYCGVAEGGPLLCLDV